MDPARASFTRAGMDPLAQTAVRWEGFGMAARARFAKALIREHTGTLF